MPWYVCCIVLSNCCSIVMSPSLERVVCLVLWSMLLPVCGCLFGNGVVFASIPVIIGVSCCLVAIYWLISCIVSWYMLFSWFILCTSSACMLMKMWSCSCTAVHYFLVVLVSSCKLCWY